jgi:hypothetical protein
LRRRAILRLRPLGRLAQALGVDVRLLVVLVAAVLATSCSDQRAANADESSVQGTLEFQRQVSAADCKNSGTVDRVLLQQSWYRDGSSDALAFGEYGFGQTGPNGISASYCLDGNVIVARTYTEKPAITVAGNVVRAFSRASVSTPDIRWRIEELTRQTLVLNDLIAGTRTTWRRRN